MECTDQLKICIKCNTEKLKTYFRQRGGNICKACHNLNTIKNRDKRRALDLIEYKRKANEKSKAWCKTKVGHLSRRNTRYKRLYGIDYNEFSRLSALQNHICPICLTQQKAPDDMNIVNAGPNGSLVIDHCHSTGIIKGLICHKCNAALGLFGESHENLLRAHEYLKKAFNY